jgi:predicted branched-subunit amino acid permease
VSPSSSGGDPFSQPGIEFLRGARDQLPILLGVVPFGVIFGALAVSAGVPALEAQSFSLFIFAGSAQFIAVSLIAGAASPFLIILTILVVNLRHLLYSASLAPHVYHLSGIGLDFALPLTFLALIMPTLTDRPAWAAACAAGAFSLLLANLPFKLGLLIPAVLGIGVGLVVETRSARVGHVNGDNS